MELIDKTILPIKQRGDGLSAAEINSINTTVNSLVDYVNACLKKYCDLNVEVGDNTRVFTLSSAIEAVPVGRRGLGMTIRFLNSSNLYSTYVYLGRELTTSAWRNQDNWTVDNTIIDGGEWQ